MLSSTCAVRPCQTLGDHTQDLNFFGLVPAGGRLHDEPHRLREPNQLAHSTSACGPIGHRLQLWVTRQELGAFGAGKQQVIGKWVAKQISGITVSGKPSLAPKLERRSVADDDGRARYHGGPQSHEADDDEQRNCGQEAKRGGRQQNRGRGATHQSRQRGQSQKPKHGSHQWRNNARPLLPATSALPLRELYRRCTPSLTPRREYEAQKSPNAERAHWQPTGAPASN